MAPSSTRIRLRSNAASPGAASGCRAEKASGMQSTISPGGRRPGSAAKAEESAGAASAQDADGLGERRELLLLPVGWGFLAWRDGPGERLELLVGQAEPRRGDVLLQVGHGRGAGDRQRHR